MPHPVLVTHLGMEIYRREGSGCFNQIVWHNVAVRGRQRSGEEEYWY